MEEQSNFLIPKHRKLSEEECIALMEKYSLTDKLKLPKIKISDTALVELKDISAGDIIEISRTSFAGDSKYFRVVIE